MLFTECADLGSTLADLSPVEREIVKRVHCPSVNDDCGDDGQLHLSQVK